MFDVEVVAYGNSLALKLPSNSGNIFKEGQRWLLIPAEDGMAFTLVPRIADPYAGPTSSNPMFEEWDDVGFDE